MHIFQNRSQCFKIGGILASVIMLITALFNIVPDLAYTTLEEVKARGELTVITRNSPNTFYEDNDGDTGMENDLVKGFAEYLGVNFKMVIANKFSDIIPTVVNGYADFAAAGLTISEDSGQIKYTPPYQEINQQVIYKRNSKKPTTIEHLYNKNIEIIAGSNPELSIKKLSENHPDLNWISIDNTESDQLLHLIKNNIIDHTIVDSNEFMLFRRFFPELDIAFDLDSPKQLAWAFPQTRDDTLYQAAVDYLNKIKQDGTLAQIIERHYGHTEKFDYVGTRRFIRHISTRLKDYKGYFIDAAEQYNLDWKLLAAVGYQESHWNKRAISPTGVRGIMMLTRKTAGQLGVKNRLNPKSSIFGGAKYLAHLIKRIDESIPEPDRTWMALASYNVGFYHLQDARKITELRGNDPNKWIDVKESLPLLAQRRWYKKTKYGYARGWEPLQYVENIRSYYDLLSWEINKTSPAPIEEPAPLNIMPNAL